MKKIVKKSVNKTSLKKQNFTDSKITNIYNCKTNLQKSRN